MWKKDDGLLLNLNSSYNLNSVCLPPPSLDVKLSTMDPMSINPHLLKQNFQCSANVPSIGHQCSAHSGQSGLGYLSGLRLQACRVQCQGFRIQGLLGP